MASNIKLPPFLKIVIIVAIIILIKKHNSKTPRQCAFTGISLCLKEALCQWRGLSCSSIIVIMVIWPWHAPISLFPGSIHSSQQTSASVSVHMRAAAHPFQAFLSFLCLQQTNGGALLPHCPAHGFCPAHFWCSRSHSEAEPNCELAAKNIKPLENPNDYSKFRLLLFFILLQMCRIMCQKCLSWVQLTKVCTVKLNVFVY